MICGRKLYAIRDHKLMTPRIIDYKMCYDEKPDLLIKIKEPKDLFGIYSDGLFRLKFYRNSSQKKPELIVDVDPRSRYYSNPLYNDLMTLIDHHENAMSILERDSRKVHLYSSPYKDVVFLLDIDVKVDSLLKIFSENKSRTGHILVTSVNPHEFYRFFIGHLLRTEYAQRTLMIGDTILKLAVEYVDSDNPHDNVTFYIADTIYNENSDTYNVNFIELSKFTRTYKMKDLPKFLTDKEMQGDFGTVSDILSQLFNCNTRIVNVEDYPRFVCTFMLGGESCDIPLERLFYLKDYPHLTGVCSYRYIRKKTRRLL